MSMISRAQTDDSRSAPGSNRAAIWTLVIALASAPASALPLELGAEIDSDEGHGVAAAAEEAVATDEHQDEQQIVAASKAEMPAPAELANITPGTADPVTLKPLLALGIGDAVSVQVYGRPELSITTSVSDDGTLTIPLAGDVQVEGLSPAQAGREVAAAFRAGKYLVNPQVTVLLTQSRSQQVSVLGAVKAPGRFAVESRTTVLDLLAMAGGVTENGADVVVLMRTSKAGKVTRQSIDLRGLNREGTPLPVLTLLGGDTVFIPPADQFYVTGEVRTPSMYRLESEMTVAQAISRGGGITPRGSSSRIEIRRRNTDGTTVTRDGKLNDPVKPNDVIRVKERFF